MRPRALVALIALRLLRTRRTAGLPCVSALTGRASILAPLTGWLVPGLSAGLLLSASARKCAAWEITPRLTGLARLLLTRLTRLTGLARLLLTRLARLTGLARLLLARLARLTGLARLLLARLTRLTGL